MAKTQDRAVDVLPFYENPETENERLFNLQKRYKETGPAALGEMYEKLREVAYKLINKISNTDPKVKALPAEIREQKAHDAATYLIEQYIKRPNFVITDNITEYLKKRVLHELYYTRNCDRIVTFTDKLPDVATEKKEFHFVVTDKRKLVAMTYNSLQELRAAFPKLRLDKLRLCIDQGETYKNYKITLLEIEV